MATRTGFARTAAFCAGLALAPGLLIVTSHEADAGIFSWLGGRNQNNGDYQQQSNPSGGGIFGGRGGGGIFQPAPRAPQSGAFHGDELPPEEGTAATRQWITNPALGTPTLSTRNIEATKAAIQRYQAIVANGGWPAVPAYAMKPGSHGEPVEILHRRLEISGDLAGQSVPNEYDEALTQAVRKFQSRHALPPTGVIDRATIDTMNVSASVRMAQLQSNLKRLQTLAPAAASRYVMVNIPAAQVEAVESGQVAQRHAAVVGKFERQTPELSSKIIEINFNPYWYVPRSIVYKDLVPKAREFAQRGQDMLAAYHMEAFDASGAALELALDQLVRRRRLWLQLSPAPLAGELAWLREDQLPEQGLRVHARYPAQEPVRPQCAVRELRLRARAQRRGPGRVDPARHAGLEHGARAGHEADQRAGRCQARQADPGLLRLYQRLGDARRRGELPS